MSDYCRKKVLRVPFDETGLDLKDFNNISYELFEKFGNMFYWNSDPIGRFDVAPTVDHFLDYVLEVEYGADTGEWGKVRPLSANEKLAYAKVFNRLSPDLDMDKVHLVEFCWYNCSEAPSYYDIDTTQDPFYKEVPFICNFTLV